LGASLRYSELDWKSDLSNFLFLNDQSTFYSSTNIDDSDSGFAFNIGGLYRPDPHISIGGVYKRNTKFEVVESQIGGFAPGSFENALKVPDTYGFGISIKPNDRVTITTDVVRDLYSQLTDNIVVGRSVITEGLTSGEISYEIKDGTEFHIGGEAIAFVGSVPVAVRVGYYRQPFARLLLDSTTLDEQSRQILNAIFSDRDPENHYTLGNGFVFGPHFQVDWALDIANISRTFVLSGVVRF
jgi:hypothetical protein